MSQRMVGYSQSYSFDLGSASSELRLQIFSHKKVKHRSDANFFGSIRQQGGNSDNPTPIQFTRAFRKLFFSSFLNSSTGNCADNFDNLLAQFAQAKSRKSNFPAMAALPKVAPHLEIGTVDYRENEVSENLYY